MCSHDWGQSILMSFLTIHPMCVEIKILCFIIGVLIQWREKSECKNRSITLNDFFKKEASVNPLVIGAELLIITIIAYEPRFSNCKSFSPKNFFNNEKIVLFVEKKPKFFIAKLLSVNKFCVILNMKHLIVSEQMKAVPTSEGFCCYSRSDNTKNWMITIDRVISLLIAYCFQDNFPPKQWSLLNLFLMSEILSAVLIDKT